MGVSESHHLRRFVALLSFEFPMLICNHSECWISHPVSTPIQTARTPRKKSNKDSTKYQSDGCKRSGIPEISSLQFMNSQATGGLPEARR